MGPTPYHYSRDKHLQLYQTSYLGGTYYSHTFKEYTLFTRAIPTRNFGMGEKEELQEEKPHMAIQLLWLNTIKARR